MPKHSNTIYQRTKTFLEKSKKVHSNKYDYSSVKYVNAHTKVEILCPMHGSFSIIPCNHTKGHGCNKCAVMLDKMKSINLRYDNFISLSDKIHKDKYDYSMVKYTNIDTKVSIICPLHGTFLQTPYNHSIGKGCPKCAGNTKSNTSEFINKSKLVHKNKYNYSTVEYANAINKVSIICHIHGTFFQTPNHHLQGNGCPQCAKSNFSQVAIKWLDKISSSEKIFIQHAENIGEYCIPQTRYYADGYCNETNTIYEFYGDCFHGNPNVYAFEDYCHPFNKEITAKQLYTKTIKRENTIEELGYNLIVIWETDFKNQF